MLGVAVAQPQRRPHSYYDESQREIQKNQDYQPHSDQQYQKNSVQDNSAQNYQQTKESNQYQDNQVRSKHESTTFIPIIRFDKEQSEDGSYKAS